MTQTLTLRRPDDWHLHLRDGAMLDAVLPHTAAHFARAIIMPNLVPPVVRGADAADRLAPSSRSTSPRNIPSMMKAGIVAMQPRTKVRAMSLRGSGRYTSCLIKNQSQNSPGVKATSAKPTTAKMSR